jgi:ferredoxin
MRQGAFIVFLSVAVTAFSPSVPAISRQPIPATSSYSPGKVVLAAAVGQEKEPGTPATSSASSVILTLTKPLGLLLEEVDENGNGVRVQDVTATGSAAPHAAALGGARVTRINDESVRDAPLDRVMELIAACDGDVRLEFQRPKVPWPVGTPVTIVVATGAAAPMEIQANVGDNLRQTLLQNNVDVYAGMQKITNCGGAGQCTLCAFDILEDHGAWEERSDYENSRLKSFPLARLTCLNVIQGPATIQKTKR